MLLGENSAEGQPTLAQCQAYADQYNLPRSKFYIDHNGSQSHAGLFSRVYYYPSADGAIYFPWNAVLDRPSNEYIYVDGVTGNDARTFLNTHLP